MFCCRRLYQAKRQLLSNFYSEEVEITTKLELISLDGIDRDLRWEAVVPEFTIATEKITSVSLDENKTRIRVCNPGETYTVLTAEEIDDLLDTPIRKPWLWIGADKDMSHLVEPYLVSGNTIKLDLLTHIAPIDWKYLCPSTFDELDFPVAGITIEDDTGLQDSETESEEDEIENS